MRLLYGFPMRSGKRAHASDVLEEFKDAVLERDLDAHGGPENCTVASESIVLAITQMPCSSAGAQALSMPEGRAESRGRSAAQSIVDGAGHCASSNA